jgi:hypothetical protein
MRFYSRYEEGDGIARESHGVVNGPWNLFGSNLRQPIAPIIDRDTRVSMYRACCHVEYSTDVAKL